MTELIQTEENIQNKIFEMRDMQVMLDKDLALLYGVETKRINEAVKNNLEKFQSDFYFKLTDDEFYILRSKFSTTDFSKTRINPKVFTEQGIYMLATILKSKIASQVTVSIIRTFAEMRKLIASNNLMFERFERIEKKLSVHDKSLDEIFNAIENKSTKLEKGIFYNGQTFDAYVFISDLIKKAKKSITLVDNYIDESVLILLSKNQNVIIKIYTQTISKQLQLDVDKYNSQYRDLEIKKFSLSHDRFLIIDNDVYHIGASLKDLGKKWFGFSKMDGESFEMMGRLV